MKEKLKTRVVSNFRVCLLVLLSVATAVFCMQYYARLQSTIQEESSMYLHEVSVRIGANVDRLIKDKFSALNTLAIVLQEQTDPTMENMKPIFESYIKQWWFANIMLIDKNGTAHNLDGKDIMLNADEHLQKTLINREQSLSVAQVVGNSEYILFAIPVEGIFVENTNIVAIGATYDPTMFNRILLMSAFGGDAYSQLIQTTGAAVTHPITPSAIKTGYNVLNSIKATAKIKTKNKRFEDITTEIDANKSGVIELDVDNKSLYMVYSPLSIADLCLITFVPTSVVNEKSNSLLLMTLVMCGLIICAFSGIFAFMVYVFNNHKKSLEEIAYVDSVTGGNTIARFYQLAQHALDQPNRPRYALMYSNMVKFKLINEEFGKEACDTLIKAYNDVLTESFTDGECLGRHSADNFCMLIKADCDADLISRIEKWFGKGEVYVNEKTPIWSLPIVEYGVYYIEDQDLTFPQMIDRAKLALKETTTNISSKLRYSIYDDIVSQKLVREKQLEDMMGEAMQAGEYIMYLQPKYCLDTGCIGGAEALTRWMHDDKMIFPDEFIPIFEKNGFIIQLDIWIFEQACKAIRRWIDNDQTPVRISVNCSRLHLRDKNFLVPYARLAEKYKVPTNLLEIELTESVVMDDVYNLKGIIEQIHDLGFECSMDDFGSGYSSLNLIQTIPVDTLKLDKIFFKNQDEADGRLESVVGSIITMAKALSMTTVAEGVEEEDQVEMLKRVKCDYVQGYVFARPVPVADFEKLTFGKSFEIK